MPKPFSELAPEDYALMNVIDVVSEQHMSQTICQPVDHGVVTHLAERETLVSVAEGLRLPEDVTPHKIAKRSLELVGRAQEQSYQLLGAAWEVLPRSVGKDRELVAEHLRNSANLARVYGAVSGTGSLADGHDSNDQRVLDFLKGRPDRYLAYDGDKRRVTFSHEGLAFLRPHLSKSVGCPVLNHDVKSSDGMINLFDAGWTDFTESYIAARVLAPRGLKAAFRRAVSL